jgi:hypothetical protein
VPVVEAVVVVVVVIGRTVNVKQYESDCIEALVSKKMHRFI